MEIIFAHGEYNARGVAILIPEYLWNDIETKKRIIDNNGIYIFLKRTNFNKELVLGNLYCQTKENSEYLRGICGTQNFNRRGFKHIL